MKKSRGTLILILILTPKPLKYPQNPPKSAVAMHNMPLLGNHRSKNIFISPMKFHSKNKIVQSSSTPKQTNSKCPNIFAQNTIFSHFQPLKTPTSPSPTSKISTYPPDLHLFEHSLKVSSKTTEKRPKNSFLYLRNFCKIQNTTIHPYF